MTKSFRRSSYSISNRYFSVAPKGNNGFPSWQISATGVDTFERLAGIKAEMMAMFRKPKERNKNTMKHIFFKNFMLSSSNMKTFRAKTSGEGGASLLKICRVKV